MLKKIILAAGIGLCIVNAQADEEMAEPFKTMSMCLIMNQWTYWGFWQFEVNALAGERILIGGPNNYFIVKADSPGFQHIANDKLLMSMPEATQLAQLGQGCEKDCPENFQKRVSWFQRRCKSY